MRIVYVCRDLGTDSTTGSGALVLAAATALAAQGHEIHLVSENLSAPAQHTVAATDGLRWQPTLPARPRHRYFTDEQCYADRVYDTLRLVHEHAQLDVIDLVDADGAALTLLRARRLLGDFADTRLVVSLHPWATATEGPQRDRPATFAHDLTTFAEQYARRHADAVLACGDAVAGTVEFPTRRYLPGLHRPDLVPPGEVLPNVVLWLGTLCPAAGLDTVLRAVVLAHAAQPAIRLVVRGEDTATDPVGRSYWQYVRQGLSEELRELVSYEGPLDTGRPPPGSLCVVAAGTAGTPTETLWAMASGCLVLAPSGSVGADIVGESGTVAPGVAAMASALVAGLAVPNGNSRLPTAVGHTPEQVAARLVAVYTSVPLPPPTEPRTAELVSIVIPVHDYGRFLPDALESVRRCGLPALDIVVVDDGSTDPGTVALLATLTDVTLVRQEHRGLSAARNAGLRHARGELVLVLDADDRIQPGFLPAAVAAMRRDDTLGFVGGYVRYFELLELVYVPAGMPTDLNLVLHTHLKSMVLYRRTAVDRVGGYDEQLPAFEDWELQLRLTLAGYDSDVLPIVGQLYRRHADSMSFRHSNGMRDELVQYLVRKHAATLDHPRLVRLLLVLVDLWKTGYEPSTSVLLQRSARCDPALPLRWSDCGQER
ncbi:glycosyltransferase [Nocardia brasiliensis]|uniref:glycosyltransferase n=1 Tax=Nocardia brasiliensis TaxID=37326 RepID=UPI003D8BDBE2